MLRHPNLLTAAVLLLSTASIGASALPRSEWQADRPVSLAGAVQQVQYSDGGRCFNRCVRGHIFQRCQGDQSEQQNCCSQACTRLNNQWYR